LRVSSYTHTVCTHSVSGKQVHVEHATAMPAILPEERYESTFRGVRTTTALDANAPGATAASALSTI
jgi:hypothetical protein